MIKNERQYNITKNYAKKFEDALAKISAEYKGDHKERLLLLKAQEDALRSQLQELQNEIAEYEELRQGSRKIFKIESFENIPSALVQARIASGLTQKELAHRLGLKEQQIQRYEATEYASASLARIIEIMQALNLKTKDNLLFIGEKDFDFVFSRLKKIGIDNNFVLKRLIPKSISEKIKVNKIDGKTTLLSIVAKIEQIFGLESNSLLSNKPLGLVSAEASFKLPKGKNLQRLNAYTIYAHYLALLVNECVQAETKIISKNPLEIREAIVSTYGSLAFQNVLRYVWDLGVVVIPLKDPGEFHAACWRIQGRNIIVLKQGSQFNSRWTFDLLHEIYHAAENPKQSAYRLIEVGDQPNYKNSPEEKAASQFAGNVLLDNKAEVLAKKCVAEANGKVEWLKTAVQKIAKEDNVLVDHLANYMAFRLSLQNINWWGAANNLQTISENPWEVARDELLKHSNFSKINPSDRELILRALSNEEE